MAKHDVNELPSALRRLSLGMSVAVAASGKKQKDLAATCGISTAYLSKMLSGQKNPSQMVLERFASALGRRVGEIYDLGDDMIMREERAAREVAVERATEARTTEALLEASHYLGREGLEKLRAEIDRRLAELDARTAKGKRG